MTTALLGRPVCKDCGCTLPFFFDTCIRCGGPVPTSVRLYDAAQDLRSLIENPSLLAPAVDDARVTATSAEEEAPTALDECEQIEKLPEPLTAQPQIMTKSKYPWATLRDWLRRPAKANPIR